MAGLQCFAIGKLSEFNQERRMKNKIFLRRAEEAMRAHITSETGDSSEVLCLAVSNISVFLASVIYVSRNLRVSMLKMY